MGPLANSSSAMLRTCLRKRAVAAPVTCVAMKQRGKADARSSASFNSPFDTNKIPDFGAYKSRGSETSNKVFQYFMAGTMGGLAAVGAKATVQGELR